MLESADDSARRELGTSADVSALGIPAEREDRLSQLEDRMALLEASTNMTYGMLKKVLRALKVRHEVERAAATLAQQKTRRPERRGADDAQDAPADERNATP